MNRAPLQLLVPCLLVALVVAGGPTSAQPAPDPDPACPGRVLHRVGAPGIEARHRSLPTWLGAWPAAALDEVLMDADAIARLNQRNGTRPAAWQDVILGGARQPARVDAELDDRFAYLRGKLDGGDYVEDVAGAFNVAEARARGAGPVDAVRALVAHADLRCVPMAAGLFRPPIDRDFDRNQCSRLHPAELVRVSRVSEDGRWLYVHTGHSVGWLEAPTLTPPLSPSEAERFRDGGVRLVVLDDWVPTSDPEVWLRMGTHLPLLGRTVDGSWHVLLPTELGLDDGFIAADAGVREGFQPLTRGNVLRTVLARLGDPYGWGGTGGARDCSRLLLDAFATFGLALGRHSSVQADSGAVVVDVAELGEGAKRAAIRRAAERGVVFLYMPGHIMLYLGELDGTPYAVSAISEYLVPCAAGGHEVVRLDAVEVTDLTLGRGTERTAFIERIAKLALLGPAR